MACFWNGILAQLTLDDFKPFYLEKKPTPSNFVLLLQVNNVRTSSVSWQNETMSEFTMEENLQAIEGYNPKHINNGYNCSICDPFLFLVAEIFKVNITHKYLNTIVHYCHIKKPERTLYFTSNTGHFQASGKL